MKDTASPGGESGLPVVTAAYCDSDSDSGLAL